MSYTREDVEDALFWLEDVSKRFGSSAAIQSSLSDLEAALTNELNALEASEEE
jgi:hypothetical protein